MMFEGKHIHYSPLNKKPLCSYSAKLCKQRRINGYAFCIRHILEDKSAPFKQCAHVARYNKQKCTNPIPSNENREFCNSHMQVAGILPKKERKIKKEKEVLLSAEGKLKFSDRLKALLTKENSVSCSEDTFNSDDPYAFPDTASESENGCIGYSATPILRNAWNSSQKNSPEVPIMDSPSRCDQASRTPQVMDNKLKSNVPTLSKTMNRLHAKIAQNKLLDKQKKTQDASQSMSLLSTQLQAIGPLKGNPMSPMDVNSINSESNEAKSVSNDAKSEIEIKAEPIEDHYNSEDSAEALNCVSSPNPPSLIQANSHLSSGMNSCSSSEKFFSDREKCSTPSDISSKDKLQFEDVKLEKDAAESTKIPIVLRKLHRFIKSKKRKQKYIVQSGLESSESESDSDAESHLLSQLSSFSAFDPQSSSSIQNMQFDPRVTQQGQLKSEHLRSYYHLCRINALYKKHKERQRGIIQLLSEATQAYPNIVANILANSEKSPTRQKKSSQPDPLTKKTCYFKQDDASCHCPNTALPYTWHCKKHIMYNVDQLLFEHCTAKFSDNTQCCVSVFDVCHELPLCLEHAKKRDNYNKMASEPKPKKPRKKPKPSALTRPPKRGKKKKKPSSVRPPSPSLLPPSSIPSLTTASCLQPEIPTVTSFPTESIKSVISNLPVQNLNKDGNGEMHAELESDLEDFSPGAIEKTLELPLDTAELANQATKLLEEHDFTEVLNKIPDDAFNDLFVDTRNGEYIPTREETEELERALAAVSKDVHLTRESLAKLSSSTTGPDLEELERTIEIHGSLLGADNLTSAIDENSFADLPNNHLDSLNVISSSFSTSDLNSFTQALSAMTPESLDQNNLPAATEGSILPNAISVSLANSELSSPHLLNGHSDSLAEIHPLQLDPAFSNNLLNSSTGLNLLNTTATNGIIENNKIFTNGSLLSTMFYNIGHLSSGNPTQSQAFSLSSISGSNTSDDSSLLTNSGALNSTNHWLLNSPDVLSQLAYQNGFLVSSQGTGVSYSNALVGKYPVQDLASELNVGSSDMSAMGCNVENVICGASEQPIHNINISNGPASSLQSSSSVKIIVQEGAS